MLIFIHDKMTLLIFVMCLQKALQLRSDEHIFKFIKSKFGFGQTRYYHTCVHTIIHANITFMFLIWTYVSLHIKPVHSSRPYLPVPLELIQWDCVSTSIVAHGAFVCVRIIDVGATAACLISIIHILCIEQLSNWIAVPGWQITLLTIQCHTTGLSIIQEVV